MRDRKSKSYFALFLIFGSFFAIAGERGTTFPLKTAARVIKITGQVWLSYGSAPKASLNLDEKILEGATLITGDSATVEIMLSDHSVLKLGAQSKIELPGPRSNADQVSVKLEEGVAKVIVKKQIGAKRTFSVKTQSATMGVRGTEFLVEVLAETHFEEVLVVNGDVEVTDNQGKQLALVEAGMGYITHAAAADGSPLHSSAPQRLANAQIEAVKNEHFLASSALLATIQLSPSVNDTSASNQTSLVKNPQQPPLPANPGSVQPSLPGGAPVTPVTSSGNRGNPNTPVTPVKPRPGSNN